MKSKNLQPVLRGRYFLCLSENRREMLRMIEAEFKRDFFDRERGRGKENFGLQDNMVHDGFLGRETGILLHQEIQMIGMSMETVGIKAH
jgi:hypothetical protein